MKKYQDMTKEELLAKVVEKDTKLIELKRQVRFYNATLEETGTLLSLLDSNYKLEFITSVSMVVSKIQQEHRRYAKDSNMKPLL